MHQRWDEVLVQRYIDGREVNVGVVGDQVLPIAEIDFGRMPRGKWRIVTYRSKWEDGCDEDVGAVPAVPAELGEPLALELERIAREAWRLVGGDGYGRCDFRIDRMGRPWLLEVNANPDISPHAGLARMARAAGMDYAALVRAVCEHATSKANTLPADRWALTQRLSGVAGQRA
jgi:D-alanine-D-alanine ligase